MYLFVYLLCLFPTFPSLLSSLLLCPPVLLAALNLPSLSWYNCTAVKDKCRYLAASPAQAQFTCERFLRGNQIDPSTRMKQTSPNAVMTPERTINLFYQRYQIQSTTTVLI